MQTASALGVCREKQLFKKNTFFKKKYLQKTQLVQPLLGALQIFCWNHFKVLNLPVLKVHNEHRELNGPYCEKSPT